MELSIIARRHIMETSSKIALAATYVTGALMIDAIRNNTVKGFEQPMYSAAITCFTTAVAVWTFDKNKMPIARSLALASLGFVIAGVTINQFSQGEVSEECLLNNSL